MAIPMEKSKAIDEGKHEGAIVAVDIRENKGYTYMDVSVTVGDLKKEDGSPFLLKAGYPLPMSAGSMTAKLFERFGITAEVGQEIDENELIATRCTYQVVAEEGKDGKTYSNILRQTLKPLE